MKEKKPARSALGRGLSALISSPPVSVHALPGASEPRKQEPTTSKSPSADEGETRLRELISGNLAAQRTAESNIVPISPLIQAGGSTSSPVRLVELSRIHNNPKQPRQTFSEQELSELTESIKKLGVLQPILVRPSPAGTEGAPTGREGDFEIVAGERRWRAAQRAELAHVPVIVRDLDDRESLELAIVENVQRADLNPVEEARAYERLASEFQLTQSEIAERVGKERATVANSLRLLRLAPEALSLVESGDLSTGHAKVILGIKDHGAQSSLAKKAVAEKLSVRELEELVARVTVLDAGKAASRGEGEGSRSRGQAKSSQIAPVIDRLRNTLGTKVIIKHHASGRGRIVVEYFSDQELDRLVEQMCR